MVGLTQYTTLCQVDSLLEATFPVRRVPLINHWTLPVHPSAYCLPSEFFYGLWHLVLA